ncbi:F0F1 ATP synthase subunit gamma [Candidatus Omnitrophota bacterium]
MKTLSVIKKDMEFNVNLSNLVETLKTIAVSQYRILEKKINSFKEFIITAESFFEFVDTKNINHNFLRPKTKEQAVIAITSDAGFLGGLNLKVINTCLEELEKIPGKLIVIGERGKLYIRGAGISSVNFPGINDENRYAQAMQLRDYILGKVLAGSFGHVKIVYPHPVSFTVQRVKMVGFIPYIPPPASTNKELKFSDIIMESKPKDAVQYLIHLLVGQRLYEIFGLSRLAEFAARYTHLEESTQKLKDRDKKVKLEYFRVRHEIIDRTMREIFAGRQRHGRK